MRRVRIIAFMTAVLSMLPATSRAEWQFTPFLGLSFGGSTTFVDFDGQAGKRKLNFGGRALWLGEVVGVEADFGHTPGYFSGSLIQSSHVTTLMGNVVVAVPRRIAEYTLRPYVVGGAGLMHIATSDLTGFSRGHRAMDIGAGVTGFLSTHVGVNWDVRYFRTLNSSQDVNGVSIAPEELSTWRATMGIVFRP